MLRKIVFVSIGSLEKYLYDALCIDSFFQAGKEVVFFDLSHWLFGEKRKHKYDFVQSISSSKEFERAIRDHLDDNTYFNIQIHYEDRFFTLFRLLKKYNCKLCRFEIGYLPEVSITNRAKNYLLKPLDMIRRIKEKTLSFLALKFGFVKLDFEFIFYAGGMALDAAEKKCRNNVAINYVDYEYYQQYAVSDRIDISSKSKYAVFLDTYLAYHEDMDYDPALGKINPHTYINALNHFFDNIEKQLGLEVIIAAHPKAHYTDDTFMHRKCIKNKTAELVFHSSLVISQHSTAISYAVFGKKPILLIVTSDMETKYQLNIIPFMKVLAEELKVPFMNVDSFELLQLPVVSNEAYDRYKYRYLTSQSSELVSNERVIQDFLGKRI